MSLTDAKGTVVEFTPRGALRVLLVGATGLIGSHCLELLLQAPKITQVIAPTRRTLPHRSDKLRNLLVDFDRLDEYEELYQVDAIMCSLGTTIKQAGSKEAFRKVDYQYCLDIAQNAREHQAKAFYLVSAVGADTRSPFFYSRVKGELETQLKRLQYNCLSIYRPSLLLGDRSEFRFGEVLAGKAAKLVNPLLTGGASRYRAIKAEMVARAMVNEVIAVGADPGPNHKVNVYTHDKIVTLAQHPEQLLTRS